MPRAAGKWEGYAVTNDEVLSMLDAWRGASDVRDKSRMEGQLVSKLTYLVQSRIKRHRGQAFYDDLLQEGRLGLLKAAHDFNPERGTNFFKFATWHIQTKVRRFLLRETRRREIPCSQETVAAAAGPCEPLDEVVERAERRRAVHRALGRMDSRREARILSLRFGMDDGQPWTLQRIGDELGITRERVRQIERHALRKLKASREIMEFA